MKSTFLFLAPFFCASALFAQDEDPFLAKFQDTFEIADSVAAKDFVPAALMSGNLHAVRPLASNDGLRNTYYVDTPEGVQEVTGTPALVQFIRELYAIDYLRGVSRTDAFTKSLVNAGKAKVESAAGLISDPFGTVKNVPKGASRFFGRIGEGLKGGGSRTEDNGVQGILGITSAKLKLASQLGVNPYSSNEELQRQLTNVARAMAGGGLAVDAATSVASGGAGVALTVVGANQTLADTLANTTPEDLRILNRKKLFALGVNRALADQFLLHPWFSPWHETITTDALATIGVNPNAFLTDAVQALTPEDAFYFQRVAQILAKYATTTGPIKSIRFDNGLITAIAKDGTFIVPVSLDYGIWTERTARRAEEFITLDRASEQIKYLTVWTDGRLSQRLCEELQKRGIAWQMHVLD